MAFTREMVAALDADGEKLRAMTGEDHGPVFPADWSDLPRDLYVTLVRRPDPVVWQVETCSVPMAIGPEVRYIRADAYATILVERDALKAERDAAVARSREASQYLAIETEHAKQAEARAEAAEAAAKHWEAVADLHMTGEQHWATEAARLRAALGEPAP